MSDKSSPVDHVESNENGAGKASRGQKIKRHCKRFWWLHLLVLIAIVVLSVCLM